MAPPAAQKPAVPGQELPGRDTANFRSMVKLYEEKRHKKALKMADTILKKHPNHGETTSMKGLICWYIPERKGDALEFAKKGLRLNVMSSTCWHVLGLLHRNGRDYNEAMRCFKQAVRLDPENMVLARDLTNLQIHEGNVSGFLEMRKSLFFTRAGMKAHWTSYAFAQHLCGNYHLAKRLLRTTIDHFQRLSGTESAAQNREEIWEHGELLLYEAMLLEEGGEYEQAVASLQACPNVPDCIGRLEALGRLLIYTNQLDKAHSTYMQLFRHQRANKTYLLCALATHPQFRHQVIFPKSPQALRQSPSTPISTSPAINGHVAVTTDKETDDSSRIPVDNITHSNDPHKALALSLYSLGAHDLHGSLSQGWLCQPRHVVFPGTPRDFEQISPDSLMSYQLRPLTPSEEKSLSEWFLAEVFDKDEKNANDSALRLLLDFVSEENRFLYYLDQLIRPKAVKGAPFFMNTVKGLCRNPSKAKLIQKLLESYLQALAAPPSKDSPTPPFGLQPSPPSELVSSVHPCQRCTDEEASTSSEAVRSAGQVICLTALASLFDFTGQYKLALEHIEKAINTTPTLSELFQLKARILKHMGDLKAAAVAMCDGREMDLADRFLNTKTVKYLLAVDDTTKASEMALYFSQDDNLTEMQSMVYELRTGESLQRQGKLGPALKQFYTVVSQFGDMKHDLFDFHWYCQRRGGFRSYLKTLRMRNRIHAQQYYRHAVENIISVLLDRYDNPVATETPSTPCLEPQATESQSDTAKDTIKSSNKKKKKKADTPPASNTTPQNPTTTPTATNKPVDDDPQGLKLLLSGEAALNEAASLVDNLRQAAQLWPQTHQLAYETYSRQGRLLLMAQCLYRLFALGGMNALEPHLAPLLCHFMIRAMAVQGKHSPENPSDEVCHELLVEFFEGSCTKPPTSLLESAKSCDWKTTHDQYLSWLLSYTPPSAMSVDYLVSAIKCVKVVDPLIESQHHHDHIIQFIDSIKLQFLDSKTMNNLIKLSTATSIQNDIKDFVGRALPRESS